VTRYTDQSLVSVNGPVIVAANSSQRVTFIEVPNDINAMIDIWKIVGVVLLLLSASRSFEMETLEFLNLLMLHGS